MNYNECVELIDWLNERFRKAGAKPWYKWAVPITWEKLRKWKEILERRQE